MNATNRGIKHFFYDVVGLVDRTAFAVNDQAMAINPQRNGERVFQSGKILIELSKKAELIGKFA